MLRDRIIRRTETSSVLLLLMTIGTAAGVAGTEARGPEKASWYSIYGLGRSEYEAGHTAQAVLTLEGAKAEALRQNATESETAKLLDTLGAAYEAEGKLEAAKAAFDQGLTARRKEQALTSEDVAISLTNESSVYWAMVKADDAIAYAKQAKEMWEGLGQTSRKEYAVAVNNLLAGYRLQDRILEATALMRTARDIYRRSLAETDPLLPQSLCSLAAVYKTAGEYRAANEVLTEALQLPSANSSTRPELRANLLSSAGDLKLVEGQLGEAEKFLREALSLQVSSSDTHVIQRAATFRSLGSVHRQQERFTEAQQDFGTALSLLEGRQGLANAERGALYNQLGVVAEERKQPKEAEQWFRKAIETLESSFGQNHPNASSAYSNLALLYMSQHHFGKAHQIFESLYEGDKAVLPSTHPDIARDLNNLGSLSFRQHRYAEAESQFREAVSIFGKALGPEHQETATARANLANALWRLDRPEEARTQYAQAVQSLEAFWGKDNPKLINLLASYASFSRLYKDAAVAEQLETRIERIRVRQAIASERGSKSQT